MRSIVQLGSKFLRRFVASASRDRPLQQLSRMAAAPVEKDFCVQELAKPNCVTVITLAF
jgi:hypothetical protein